MKKLLCLVLCLCMLIPAAAPAERKVITALAAEINPEKLESAMVDARITGYSREAKTLTLEIIVPELYDAEGVQSLQEGDAVYTQGHEVTCDILVHSGQFFTVIQEKPRESVLLAPYDDQAYMILDGDDKAWTVLAEMEVPLPDKAVFMDCINPATGMALSLPPVYSAVEFLDILENEGEAGPGFAANNVTVIFDAAGNPEMIRRHYTLWTDLTHGTGSEE